MHKSWAVLLWLCPALAVSVQAKGPERIDFEAQIRPVLRSRCGECHGPKTQTSDLRLDAKHAAFKGGLSGEVIVPGKSAESELFRRVTSTDKQERMPPEGEPLSKAEIRLLKRWINAGAPWPETDYDREAEKDPRRAHWAFQPVGQIEPPARPDDESTLGPIDRFILEKLEENGLAFSPRADRRTLIRRLSWDLLGLPPSPREVEAFVKDPAPDAYARLVDSMLASPRYGERWAQHWLDVVRYADTHGFEVNTPRDHAWPYRDYVIRSFNEDKPYDQFVREQIAGDAFDADEATGFLVASAVLLPGQIGADDESKRLARQDALDEIIQGTSATFLGLTVGCARCHDHKFDPIPHRDYYAMQAFFAGVEYGDRPLRNEAYRKRLAEADDLKPRIEELAARLRTWEPMVSAEVNAIVTELNPLIAKQRELRTPQLVYAGTFRTPDETFLLRRGDPEQRGEPVGPAVPEVLGELDVSASDGEQERRVKLAHWIASPENPLTARVMVNRVWLWHFGRGLVETPSDFGLNGIKPTHPELLDRLAGEFIRSGWSIKHLHRLIVLSRTYQQQSAVPLSASGRDDRWLWRFPSRRLEAEAIRDGMLSVSGELNDQMGGPGFNFFKSRGGLTGFLPVEKFGPDKLRRMIYAHKVRMENVPVFGAFDCPNAGQATPKRSQSTTAIQSLNLFNSPFVIERAKQFAARVREQSKASIQNQALIQPSLPLTLALSPQGRGDTSVASDANLTSEDFQAQVKRAFQLALCRDPNDKELQASVSIIERHGLETLCRALFNTNEFLFLP